MDKRRLRVLLVDDDEDEYVLIKGMFARLPGQDGESHYELDWASSYEKGLRACEERPYDIYLIDYFLGAKNGLDLMRAAVARGCSGPFILLTGQGSYELDLAAMQQGVFDYLLKDQLNEYLLERSIRYAIGRKEAQDELELRVQERTRELEAANEQLAEANRELQDEMARRTAIEETLRESEERFRSLAETTSAAIFIVQDLKIRYANPAARFVTGYQPAELLGVELWTLAHPAYQTIFKRDVAVRQWSEYIPSRYEVKIITKLGQERWVDVTAGKMQYEKRPAWIFTAFDITERDLAEQELRKAKNELEQRIAERTAEIQAANRRLQTVLRTLPVAIAIADKKGRLVESNEGFQKLWGATDLPGKEGEDLNAAWNEWARRNVFRSGSGEPVAVQDLPLVRAVKRGETVLNEIFDIKTLDGQMKTVITSAVPLLDAEGQLTGGLAVAQDITHQRQLELAAQNAARETKRRADELEGLHRATRALLSTLDLDALLCQILDAAQSAIPAAEKGALHIISPSTGTLQLRATLTGGNQRIHVMRSSNSKELPARVVRERRPVIVNDVAADGGISSDTDDADGEGVRSLIMAPFTYDEQALGVIALSSSKPGAFTENNLNLLESFATTITAALHNALLHAEVKKLAVSDPLTGQYNRRAFFDLGKREVERFLRFNHPLSAVMIDIDHFKEINDSYGHAVGDQVLRLLASVCARSIRETDIFGRYGGDEFALLLPDTDLFSAQHIANRIHEAVSESPLMTAQGPLSISISMGVVQAQKGHRTLEELLAGADLALYKAKAKGRNKVEVLVD